jgi:hypothetical protein
MLLLAYRPLSKKAQYLRKTATSLNHHATSLKQAKHKR